MKVLVSKVTKKLILCDLIGYDGMVSYIIEGVRARVGQLTKPSIFSLVCICVTLILTLPAAKLHHAEWKIELSAIT